MLKFNGAWRFDSPGPISDEVVGDFFELIGKVAVQGDRQDIIEHYKVYFASAFGSASNRSSSASWAETDLHNYMRLAAANAPLFIEAFYDACEALLRGKPDIAVPDSDRMNRVLLKHQTGYEIDPPNLVARNPHRAVAVAERAASLDEQAQEMIQEALSQSEQLLAEGRSRQAVQEILWLLETVSTAFQGLETEAGTIEGKYFNKIAADLRRNQKGKTLEQVLGWLSTLHGYLSSPTGGGVRHGADLRTGIAMQHDEARLFCNLIRSYISFLMAEHERLMR